MIVQLLLPSIRGLVVLNDRKLLRVLLFGSSHTVTPHLLSITFSTTFSDIVPLLALLQLSCSRTISTDSLLLTIFALCATMVWTFPYTTFSPCPLTLLISAPYPPLNLSSAIMISRITVLAPSGVSVIVTNYITLIALSASHLNAYQSNCLLNLKGCST